MQPSTWNDTNQHWIPQFLLKGFGIQHKASSIYQMDKQTKAIAVRKVSEVASKPRLLTERDDDMMHVIESRAATPIATIRKGQLDRIGENDRQAVDRLVCAMILNDPYSGFDDEATRKNVIAEVIRKLSEAVSRYGGMLDESDSRDLLAEQMPHDQLSHLMDSTSNQVVLALKLMGLHTCRPANGEFFVIGDSPVLVVRGTVNGATSLLNPGSQVVLPISSRCILVYTWATEMNVIDDGGTLDTEQVRSLNADYYHGTKSNHIYGRCEETLKRSRLLRLKWAPHERSNDVKNGWDIMRHRQQVRKLQLDVRAAAQAKILDYGAHELVELAIAESTRTASTGER